MIFLNLYYYWFLSSTESWKKGLSSGFTTGTGSSTRTGGTSSGIDLNSKNRRWRSARLPTRFVNSPQNARNSDLQFSQNYQWQCKRCWILHQKRSLAQILTGCHYNQHFSSTITIKLSNRACTMFTISLKERFSPWNSDGNSLSSTVRRTPFWRPRDFFFSQHFLFVLENRAYNIKHANK